MKFPRLRRRTFFRSLLFGAPLLAIADALACEPHWLRVRKFQLNQKRTGLRMVHFTDLHHKGDRKYLQRVVARINGLTPDFVCFSGDIIEETQHLAEALELFQTIKAPLFGVPGNHDYWADADFELIDSAFRATGGRFLLDEAVVFRNQVQVQGLTCQTPVNIVPANGLSTILLMHYPEWVEKIQGVKMDLILAGHSHGGQVRLPFYGPLVVPYGVGKYDLGTFLTPAGKLYVSSGVGWFYFPVRFNCRPEINLWEI